MEDELEKEIQDVLSTDTSSNALQTPISENQSPLTQSVKNGDIAKIKSDDAKQRVSGGGFRETAEREYAREQAYVAREDAPEQQIEQSEVHEGEKETAKAIISDKQATQTAEALLGMADNFLAVGGGFFVKIRKHEEFFEFEELVEVIDSQNEKNIRRIRLDADDKALLTPLLAQVIKNKTKQLSPEQQLLGAVISVIVKKAQTVMEVRAENKSLEGRILQIVREAKLPDTKDKEEQEGKQTPEEPDQQAPLENDTLKEEVIVDSDDDFEFDPVIYDVENTQTRNVSKTSNEATGMNLVYEEAKPTQALDKKHAKGECSAPKNRQRVMQTTEEILEVSDDTS